ncbi:hypothetical protein GCM10017620_31420 [Brevundimonas intermedia]|uniref:Flagella basal body P-ring formation protein FlgA C-terminal domain-containing protein n=1 Tax=Brevundimonas intermedia TaxID=74315 RepID=A0ABQ5TCU6_9CAUL|nr:hypothetical protein [Brevundimonas intermedia]GLK50168.1 hypothetical protein GCM10017620_31420 [Brevundimonas intermedia]
MDWVSLILAISSVQPAPLVLSDEVVISGDALRLADVADLSGLPDPLARRAGDIVLARLTETTTSVSARTAAARARAALPGLSPWLPDGPDHAIVVERRGPQETVDVVAALPFRPAAAPLVRVGETLSVRAVVGPVVIERPAMALQDGWPGRSIFVRTSDGAVLTVALGGAGA